MNDYKKLKAGDSIYWPNSEESWKSFKVFEFEGNLVIEEGFVGLCPINHLSPNWEIDNRTETQIELEDVYGEFLEAISNDLVFEIGQQVKLPLEIVVENRLDILREDIKLAVKNKL